MSRIRRNLRATEIAVCFSTVSFRNTGLLKLKERILAQIMISIKIFAVSDQKTVTSSFFVKVITYLFGLQS